MEKTNTRIAGFDLARAYAILGMLIVNFNVVFGNLNDPSWLAAFMRLFNGNSSTVFVMLAGMGVAFMTGRLGYSPEEKKKLRSTVLKRATFLFVSGMLLFLWWPADILHFYAIYMEVAALVLFVPSRYYLWLAAAAVVVFHALILAIPFETGWNFSTYAYADFWTVSGFLRNTFYNGWNAAFPWLAFFFVGMWLGRLDWKDAALKRTLFWYAIAVFVLVEAVQLLAVADVFPAAVNEYLAADYLPPFLPFQLSTISFGILVLLVCFWLGERFVHQRWLQVLSATGQMTLTHYVSHTTLGMVVFAILTNVSTDDLLARNVEVAPIWILLFSIGYFTLSVALSAWWSSRFKNGPLEALMRWVTR